jgi:geranylgeranyl transferase type-1 subunit beta
MGSLSRLTSQDRLIEWLLHRQCGGVQGRINKIPDTCYGFWIGGSLALLDSIDFLNSEDAFEFYKDCEAEVGGFRKNPLLRPDIVHTYYSLAYLSLTKYPGLQPLDARLGISLLKAR